jgi:hypothetical protein
MCWQSLGLELCIRSSKVELIDRENEYKKKKTLRG